MSRCLMLRPTSVVNWTGMLSMSLYTLKGFPYFSSLLALAQGAKTYKLTRPRITKENIIQIKGGR